MKLQFKKYGNNSDKYKIFLPERNKGNYKFVFSFRVENNFLEQFYLYARLKANSKKRSFPNFEFSAKRPGIKFGPWPGWRFVSDMPDIYLLSKNEKIKLKYFFTGEEQYTNIVKAWTDFSSSGEDSFLLLNECSSLILHRVEQYKSEKVKLSNKKVKIYKDRLQEYPRLLFGKKDLETLRFRIKGRDYKKIPELLTNRSLPWKITPEVRTLKGEERLNILDEILLTSFHALITKESGAMKEAKDAFKKFITISSRPDYEPMQIDTQTGICLFYMCLSYDWLYNFLTDEERINFKRHIDISKNKLTKFLTHERTDFAQAHFLGCVSGLLAYSLLFYEEEKDSKTNILFIAQSFITALKMFPDDGSYPHGINLWIYEYTFLARITEMLYRFTDLNFWERKEFWKNSSMFRQLAASPDLLYGVTFGDPQFRVCGDAWIHFLIALRTKCNKALSFGNNLADLATSGVDHRNVMPSRRIFEFIYSEQRQKDKYASPDGCFLFKDTGQVFIRKNDFLFTVKCGAPLGMQRYKMGEWSGYGHSDPNNGAFLVYDNGVFSLVGQESSYKRNTEFHNTITINGIGQIGDKMVWSPDLNLKKHFPVIKKVKLIKGAYLIDMDLTPCYFDFLGVNSINRKLLVFDKSLFLGVDNVSLDQDNKIEWNGHSFNKFIRAKNRFRLSDEVGAEIIFLNNINDYKSGETPFVPGYPNAGKKDYYLKIIENGKRAQFVYLISTTGKKYHIEYDYTKHNYWRLSLKMGLKEYLIEYDREFKVR